MLDAEVQWTPIDGLIKLQRARKYLTGFYGGERDQNDLEAAHTILLPREKALLDELDASSLFTSTKPTT